MLQIPFADKDICNTVYAIKSIHTGYDCFLSMDREVFLRLETPVPRLEIQFLRMEIRVSKRGNGSL